VGRLARIPRDVDRQSRVAASPVRAAARAPAWLRACLAALLAVAFIAPASAQDPSVEKKKKAPSAFPEQPGGMFGEIKRPDSTQPLHLQGDQLIYDSQGNRVVARGNVEIFYNNNILTADEVVYDRNANTLTAAGNVTLKEPNGNVVRADRYTLTDDFRDGFVQSLSIVARDDTRISADRAVRRDGNTNEFVNGRFTPCKSEGGMPPLWCLSAARIIHDAQAATITYQDAQFEILGQPVLYLPYFQHADPSVKRKSGFLMPEGGYSSTLGAMVEVPYYFALSDSYDFLFNPLYLAEQGVLWQGTWRQRLANGQYTVKFAAIDQDADTLPASVRNREEGWRGSVETKGLFNLGSWWSAGWDLTFESDDTFRRFYKLDSVLVTDRVNTLFFDGLSERNYFSAKLYHFGGLLIDSTPESESLVHPIIDHNYVFADPVLGGELRWNTNVLSFSRDDIANDTKNQSLQRIVTEAKWRRRLTDAIGITYTPFAELRGDIIQANDFVDPTSDPAAPTIVGNDTVGRGLATGGATVAYPWVANSAAASHVIEPIGQLIARQNSVTQDRLPDEDARSLVFDDTNLFEPQKFSGYDRLETGTRANVGVQYTFQSYTGGYARFLAGQSFHLAGDNAYADPGRASDGSFVFSPSSGLETDRSDYVLGAYLAPTDFFRVISQSRFDEDDLALRREDLAMRVDAGPLLAYGSYSYAAEDPELGFDIAQQDVVGGLGFRLTPHWTLLGTMRFDIDSHERLMDSIQLRYGDECFVLSATYSESFITDEKRDIEPDRTFMLRFELKHIGQFGVKTDQLDHIMGDAQPPKI
jgi:LPS-assembly protein